MLHGVFWDKLFSFGLFQRAKSYYLPDAGQCMMPHSYAERFSPIVQMLTE